MSALLSNVWGVVWRSTRGIGAGEPTTPQVSNLTSTESRIDHLVEVKPE